MGRGSTCGLYLKTSGGKVINCKVNSPIVGGEEKKIDSKLIR